MLAQRTSIGAPHTARHIGEDSQILFCLCEVPRFDGRICQHGVAAAKSWLVATFTADIEPPIGVARRPPPPSPSHPPHPVPLPLLSQAPRKPWVCRAEDLAVWLTDYVALCGGRKIPTVQVHSHLSLSLSLSVSLSLSLSQTHTNTNSLTHSLTQRFLLTCDTRKMPRVRARAWC